MNLHFFQNKIILLKNKFRRQCRCIIFKVHAENTMEREMGDEGHRAPIRDDNFHRGMTTASWSRNANKPCPTRTFFFFSLSSFAPSLVPAYKLARVHHLQARFTRAYYEEIFLFLRTCPPDQVHRFVPRFRSTFFNACAFKRLPNNFHLKPDNFKSREVSVNLWKRHSPFWFQWFLNVL